MQTSSTVSPRVSVTRASPARGYDRASRAWRFLALHRRECTRLAWSRPETGKQLLRQDLGHLVEVEDDVELADVGELLVQQLDEQVDGLQPQQLVGRQVHAQYEEESGVAAVDELVVAELDKVGVLGVTRHDEAVDLGL
ncbi:hypothetical protein ON010_g247 [Phytophthora cinnamomi]|nr:hypothetical protein ON010_g247 [Phytophthora cinnamomi]